MLTRINNCENSNLPEHNTNRLRRILVSLCAKLSSYPKTIRTLLVVTRKRELSIACPGLYLAEIGKYERITGGHTLENKKNEAAPHEC